MPSFVLYSHEEGQRGSGGESGIRRWKNWEQLQILYHLKYRLLQKFLMSLCSLPTFSLRK